MQESNIILYETEDGKINIDVILKDETIWVTQKSIAELFDCSKNNIGLHLKNIFLDKELDKNSTTEIFSAVQKGGNCDVKRNIILYKRAIYIVCFILCYNSSEKI